MAGRKIDVTNGEKEYVAAKVTEKNGADLSGATFHVGLATTSETPPGTWQSPDDESVSGSTATVSLLVDNVNQIGDWRLWVKVTDAPEVIFLPVTTTRITVV